MPARLRHRVRERANLLCEYCLIHETDTFLDHQVEHVISVKHNGHTTADNLALACVFCNRFKGSDIATLKVGSNELIRLYNPRADEWGEHFRINGPRIDGVSDVGRATAVLLCMNLTDRLQERELLMRAGRYPSPEARRRAGLS